LDLDILRSACVRFRRALEACDRQLLPCTFENFPRGACGDTTYLLAKFLEESGFGSFDYVLGERGTWFHAWLQQGDVIVDITGDQFDDMPEAVFISRASSWHRQFSPEVQHVADFEKFGEPARATLRMAYQAAMESLGKIEHTESQLEGS